MDETFQHSYVIRELTEIPNRPSIQRYYYPGASPTGGRDGILLEVQPAHGKPWIGVFAPSGISPKEVSGIFTTPDPHRVCVVTAGIGYLVSTDDPRIWEDVEVAPIRDVRPVPSHRILVFADFTDLVAYGDSGLKWRTNRLAWDDLTITEITDVAIRGEYWDPSIETTRGFSVNLETGASEGDRPEF